jgi:hypothetical protein
MVALSPVKVLISDRPKPRSGERRGKPTQGVDSSLVASPKKQRMRTRPTKSLKGESPETSTFQLGAHTDEGTTAGKSYRYEQNRMRFDLFLLLGAP